MINFRYHLVSLVAVFLALTVGIVIGSTVVDQAIVDGLRNQIDAVRSRARDTDAQNNELRGDVDRLGEYVDASAPVAVAGRLTGVPVAVLAARGVDPAAVRDAVDLLRRSGAQTPVIIWLEPEWSLDDAATRERLGTAIAAAGSPQTLRALALERLARRLGADTTGRSDTAASGPTPSTTTTTGALVPGTADALVVLREAGFVSVDGVGGGDPDRLGAWPGPGARVLVVGGTGSDLAVPDLLAEAAAVFEGAGVPSVLGEVYEPGNAAPERAATLAPIRGDEELSSRISTVDDLELTQGRVAAVLTLEDLGRAVVGHYGLGSGASGQLPRRTGS